MRVEVTEAADAELAAMREELAWLDAEVHRHLTARESMQLQQLLRKLHDGLLEGR